MRAMRNDFIERIAATENRLVKWMIGGFSALGAFLVAAMAILE